MSLDDIRKDIDAIDRQIKELIMRRLDCSTRVVDSKIADGNYTIYRADREEAILEKLGAGVPDDRKAGYLAVVRKITETSRMYQYGILYEQVPELFPPLIDGIDIPADCRSVVLRITRPNIPNAMSSILSMIGDYGYDMEEMRLISYSDDKTSVDFELVISGNLNEVKMQKLIFQLSMESANFKILKVIA